MAQIRDYTLTWLFLAFTLSFSELIISFIIVGFLNISFFNIRSKDHPRFPRPRGLNLRAGSIKRSVIYYQVTLDNVASDNFGLLNTFLVKWPLKN